MIIIIIIVMIMIIINREIKHRVYGTANMVRFKLRNFQNEK